MGLLKMLNIKKKNNEKSPEEKKEQVPQNFMSLLFNFLINYTNCMFSFLNNITSNPIGLVWGILILLALFAHKGMAADTNESSITHQSPINLFLNSSNFSITQEEST